MAWYVCTHTIIYCWYSPYSDMSSNLLFDLSGCQTSMSVQHTHYSLSPSVPPSLPSILAFPLTHPPLLPPSLTHSPPLTPPLPHSLSFSPTAQGCSAGLISVELVKNMLAAKPHSTALIGKYAPYVHIVSYVQYVLIVCTCV